MLFSLLLGCSFAAVAGAISSSPNVTTRANIKTQNDSLWIYGPAGVFVTTDGQDEPINVREMATAQDATALQLQVMSDALDQRITNLAGLTASEDAKLGQQITDLAGLTASEDAKLGQQITDLAGLTAKEDAKLGQQITDLAGLTANEDAKLGQQITDLAGLTANEDAKLGQQITDLAGLTAKEDVKLGKRITNLNAKVDQAVTAVDERVARENAALGKQVKALDDEHSATQTKVGELEKALSSFSNRFEAMVTEVGKIGTFASKLDNVVKDVEVINKKAKCNFNGELVNNKCECNQGWKGALCERPTVTTSCKDASDNKEFGGNGELAIYRASSVMKVYCRNGDKASYGSGWELIMNLDPKDSTPRTYSNDFWTKSDELKPNGVDQPFGSDFKGIGYAKQNAYNEVLIVAHNGNGVPMGWGQYDMTVKGESWHELMSGGQRTITSTRKSKGGGLKGSLQHNSARPQRLYGDIFVDEFNHALVANKQGGWCAARNLNRLATTLSNCDYAHTYAGLGGWHEQGFGSWRTRYESAPISPYCSLRRGYGNTNQYSEAGGFGGGCKDSSQFRWVNVKFSLYVR